MSLLNALSTATSGLIAVQSSIDVASRNIANAGVEGYTRKTQVLSTRVIDGEAAGVRTEEVTRYVNTYLQRDVRDQSSVVAELEVIDDFLGRLELDFGRPEDNSSLAAKITTLKEKFQQLATNPDQSTAQNDVLLAAADVAEAFNSLSGAIQALRAEADQRISDTVTTINEALTNIEALNTEIGPRKVLGQSTADLEDERDRWVQTLAEQMDIKVLARSDGKLAILDGTSQFLLDQTAVTLSFTPSNNVSADVALNDILLDDGFTAPFAITSNISDGTLAGLIQLRDTLLPLAQDQIDSLAFELAQQFDSITVGATTAGLDLFTDASDAIPGTDQGFSAVMQVRSTITGTQLRDGDGTGTFTASGVSDSALPLAILDMFDTRHAYVAVNGLNSTSATLEDFAAEFIGYQANQRADFESQHQFQDQIRSLLNERLTDESGVNIDEELAGLIQLESAYAASARVLNSVQTALDELLAVVR